MALISPERPKKANNFQSVPKGKDDKKWSKRTKNGQKAENDPKWPKMLK